VGVVVDVWGAGAGGGDGGGSVVGVTGGGVAVAAPVTGGAGGARAPERFWVEVNDASGSRNAAARGCQVEMEAPTVASCTPTIAAISMTTMGASAARRGRWDRMDNVVLVRGSARVERDRYPEGQPFTPMIIAT